MYRTALRTVPTATLPRATSRAATKRFITTAPPHKTSRSWKNSAVRWGLAGTLVYYYNTAVVFAEEPAYYVHSPPEAPREDETYANLDTLAEQRRSQRSATAPSPPPQPNAPSAAAATTADTPPASEPEALEAEAGQEGAFNEETGEINWGCPCLGGMAEGPCGEDFKAAFSCFVFSKEEPKGVDCIENFKAMQTCFRKYPEIYGAELDDEELEAPPQETQDAIARNDTSRGEKLVDGGSQSGTEAQGRTERAQAASQQVKTQHDDEQARSETDQAVPKAWHDATGEGKETAK